MNLHHITTDLDLMLRRRLRRSGKLGQWHIDHGLSHSLDTLYAQIRDLDRDVSHPVLATLVDLAKLGDTDAAEVVTVALLGRFADKEQKKGGTWAGFDGYLYEAIVTCHSTQSRCLREIIERNALRRHLKERIAGANDIAITWDVAAPCNGPGPEEAAVRTDLRVQIAERLDDLVCQRAIPDVTRRILMHIATGSDRDTIPEFRGRHANTVRTRCRRAARSVRDDRLRRDLRSAVA